MKKWRKYLSNSRGFTLVELLAVIVILGIIAAIAVPSIGTVIDNSRKDAHISNAQSIKEAARLYDTSEDIESTISGQIKLKELIDKDYIEPIDAPGDAEYHGDSYVNLENNAVRLLSKNDKSKAFVTGGFNELDRTSVSLEGESY